VVVPMKLPSPGMRFGGSFSISGDDNPSILRLSSAVYLATSPPLQTNAERGPLPGCKLFRRLCGHHWQACLCRTHRVFLGSGQWTFVQFRFSSRTSL
jgi:hypothetical protein